MTSSYDERHWYGPLGWRTLKARVLHICVEESEALFDALEDGHAPPDVAIASFLDGVVGIIGTRADQAIRSRLAVGDEGVSPSSMWAFALPLFADVEPLAKALLGNIRVLMGITNRPVRPMEALCEAIRQFMEDARVDLAPGSAQRRRNWEMMDRVSLEIARLNIGTALGDRRSDEHQIAVGIALKEKYPTNKNVNVSLETRRAYFDEFCPACEEFASAAYYSELEALAEETGVWPTIDRCVEALKREDFRLWEVLAVKTQTFDEVAEETQKAFLARTGVSRTAFDQMYLKAGLMVRECCDNSVEFQLLDLRRRWK